MLKNKLRQNKKYRLTLPQVVVLGFVGIILLGCALLCLPFSTKSGSIAFEDALFTATSATCVTGLTVAETVTTFTVFGQIVILLLIQIGGLGFMTLSSALYIFVGKRIALSTQIGMQNDFDADVGVSHFKKIIKQILIIAFICEFAGAVVLTVAFSKYFDFGDALKNGIFVAISSFCNAGFDLTQGGGGSLIPYNDNPLILITIMILIVLGGIGFLVLQDIFTKRRWSRLKLHTKVVLCVSTILILVGAVSIAMAEWSKASMADMTIGQKILNSFFASITARTAGFFSIDMSVATQPSLIITILLMFVGASPSSTGGGIKTTTLFILIAVVVATVRQKNSVIVAKREISRKIINKALSVLVIALGLITISLILMSLFDGTRFTVLQLLFEEVSAFATVGLSMGITAGLSVWSKLILIFSMFVGRIGMLTFFTSLAPPDLLEAKIQFKQAQISI